MFMTTVGGFHPRLFPSSTLFARASYIQVLREDAVPRLQNQKAKRVVSDLSQKRSEVRSPG